MGSGFLARAPVNIHKKLVSLYSKHCKNCLLVKASQSSLYREIENLMLWFIPVGNNIPKDFALRQLGDRMLNEMTDALTACNLALQTRELRQRLELINLIKLHMTTVQSITKVFVEFSSREGNVRRVISQKQRAALLKMMASIGGQMARWAKSTESALQQDNCIRKGDLSLWDRLPKHKSLFTMDGMAIGNITSQLLANFYLDKFDGWAVGWCKERGGMYCRFVDDIVVVFPNKGDVTAFMRESKAFLERELGLTLHPDKVYIQHAKKGVKFVGSVIMPGRIYVSNRTVGRLYDMLREMERFCKRVYGKRVTCEQSAMLEHYVCACNSYMGFLKYNSSYALKRKIFGRLEHFWKVAYVGGRFNKVVLRRRFRLSECLLKENDLLNL